MVGYLDKATENDPATKRQKLSDGSAAGTKHPTAMLVTIRTGVEAAGLFVIATTAGQLITFLFEADKHLQIRWRLGKTTSKSARS